MDMPENSHYLQNRTPELPTIRTNNFGYATLAQSELNIQLIRHAVYKLDICLLTITVYTKGTALRVSEQSRFKLINKREKKNVMGNTLEKTQTLININSFPELLQICTYVTTVKVISCFNHYFFMAQPCSKCLTFSRNFFENRNQVAAAGCSCLVIFASEIT